MKRKLYSTCVSMEYAPEIIKDLEDWFRFNGGVVHSMMEQGCMMRRDVHVD